MNKELNAPVTDVKGIGGETGILLNDMGIYTVNDLIEYFPYRYDDNEIKEIETLVHGDRVTLQGEVQSIPTVQYYGKRKSKLTFRILIGRVLVTVSCFNQQFLKNKIELGAIVTVSGKWDKHRLIVTANSVKFGQIDDNGEIEPVYSIRGRMTVKGMRRFIKSALTEYGQFIIDIIPNEFKDSYKLLSKKDTVEILHFPMSKQHLKHARRRMVYEEFLLFQLKMQALRKIQRENAGGVGKKFESKNLQEMISTLPFPLTNAQQRVVTEITDDLTSHYRMNRLLQGDVGSGKTVVAAIGLYANFLAGFQGALMVPTEILAEQHFESLKEIFDPINVKVELLTGSVRVAKRRELHEQLQNGEIHILVGTHALIQDDVHFKKLGFVITDEQHRFGVKQRKVLREKGLNPDVLFMTATPIPRTLAITAFGEMDVSTIDEMPAGRKVIETYWVKGEILEKVLSFVEKELENGRQAYVICPLIEESEKLDVQNAIDVHDMLAEHYRGKWEVGLMHGRLHPSEKDEVMKQFSNNQSQILVSTTVVEVGVNVPNATVMLIYDAERFGLSQLHQLRGRVGRGKDQSYCILLADPKSAVGKERMKIMTETNDGFVLSEKDLELRGPGDFFGNRQSGLPEFKVADMLRDFKALEVARKDATNLISSKSFWQEDKFSGLRSYVESTGVLDGEKLD